MIQPEELARFCELLKVLLSGDNDLRKQSEALYEQTKKSHPDQLCNCLVTVLTQAGDEALRMQSAVLLRQCLKAIRSDFIWPHVTAQTREAVMAQLVHALRTEQARPARNRICDAVSALASHLLDPDSGAGGWPALGPALAELVEATGDPRESAVRILKEMLASNPPAAQALVSGRMANVLQLCHTDPSASVRKESVLLFAAVLEHLPPSESESVRGLLPQMLQTVQQFEASETELHECLGAFVQIVEVLPAIFQKQAGQVIPMMITIARAAESLGDAVRQMAFEFLTLLCEKRTKMCTKIPNFAPQMVQTCMEFMLEMEDDETWVDAEDAGYAEVSNYDVGLENMDRFAKSIGAAEFLGHVFAVIKEFVSNSSWKHRYVAIMTLSQCAETVETEAHVDQIVLLLLSLLQDQHPRVRYAALHAIGQTSTDHTPYLQENFHEKIMPAISNSMDDHVLKVAAHACAAFVNFAEDLESEMLLPFVPGLMEKLCAKVTSPVRVQREQAVTAIAVIAGVIDEHFVAFYPRVVPVLKLVITSATGVEDRVLRGKAFECFSLLGMAVGRERFKQDAMDAMQSMMETASGGLDADDLQKSYIQEAVQRICRALKEDFVPYLQFLLPGVYTTLQMQAEEVVDPDAEEGDMTVRFLEDGKAVGLKTTQIEDFKSGVQMVGCFLEVLGGHYFDHIQDTARALMPALSFRFCEDVKRVAVQAWEELINAAKDGLNMRQVSDRSLIAELLRAYLQATIVAMREEEDLTLLQVQAIGTSACVKAAGPGTMLPNEVQELCAELQRLLEESTQRQRAAPPDEQLDEDDQAEAEQQRDTDQLLRVNYAELFGNIMEVHKAAFLQGGLQQVLAAMQECLLPERSASDRYLALYLADEILEKLGEDGVQTWPLFMPQLLAAIKDEDVWVRQAAAYGVLYAGRLGSFSQFADTAAQSIGEVISHPKAKSKANREATEAAIAALGILCRSSGGQFTASERCLALFLEGLPLQHDLEQAGPTHELLMAFVRGGHPLLQREAGKVCRIFLDIYGHDTSTEGLNSEIRKFFLEVGEERIRQLQPPISDKQQKRLKKILFDAKKASVMKKKLQK